MISTVSPALAVGKSCFIRVKFTILFLITSFKMSEVWTYFTIDKIDDTRGICNICKKSFSRGGKTHNTSNLKKHLIAVHNIKFEQVPIPSKQLRLDESI